MSVRLREATIEAVTTVRSARCRNGLTRHSLQGAACICRQHSCQPTALSGVPAIYRTPARSFRSGHRSANLCVASSTCAVIAIPPNGHDSSHRPQPVHSDESSSQGIGVSSADSRMSRIPFGHAPTHDVHPSQYSGTTQGNRLGMSVTPVPRPRTEDPGRLGNRRRSMSVFCSSEHRIGRART